MNNNKRIKTGFAQRSANYNTNKIKTKRKKNDIK